jgi:hypothetical protein
MNIVGFEAAGWLGWWQKFKLVVVTCWNIKLDMSVVGPNVVQRLR